MLSAERQEQILEILKEHRRASVDFLSKNLYASAATVRRDLAHMEEMKMLRRVRGGAERIDGINRDTPLLVRANKNRDLKEKIAALALRFTQGKRTMFLDSSSTVTVLAERMAAFRNITAICSGMETLRVLNERSSAELICCGGNVMNNSSIVGAGALHTIESYHADVCFFSCCGLSLPFGTTEALAENAAVKKAMCRNADLRVLLCDSTKFGRNFFCRSCGFSEIDIIVTDREPDEDFRTNCGCKVVYA